VIILIILGFAAMVEAKAYQYSIPGCADWGVAGNSIRVSCPTASSTCLGLDQGTSADDGHYGWYVDLCGCGTTNTRIWLSTWAIDDDGLGMTGELYAD